MACSQKNDVHSLSGLFPSLIFCILIYCFVFYTDVDDRITKAIGRLGFVYPTLVQVREERAETEGLCIHSLCVGLLT